MKWPAFANKMIYIQQDNARPHINNNDPEFRAAASSNGFDIQLVQQPPNSPNTNINDLGWFRAIQSLQTQSVSYSVESLVNAVCVSYDDLEVQKLNNVFLSLQGCMLEIMKLKGQNCYKLPHMKKGALLRQDLLPLNLEVPALLVRECIDYLTEHGAVDDIEDLLIQLGLQHSAMDTEIEVLMNQLGLE